MSRPEATRAASGSTPMIARARVDLPQPLSPTNPVMLPAGTASTAPSTARTGPLRVR